VWSAIAAAVLLGLAFTFYPRATPVDLVTAQSGPMITTVDEEGFARIHDVFTLSAPVAGRLKRIEVHSGDAVSAGETLLLELEPVDSSLLDPRSQAQARAEVRAAESARKLAAGNLERAQAELDFADAEYQRAIELVREGTVAQRTFDDARRTFRTATAAVGTAREALHIAQFELDRAQAQLLSPATGKRRAEDCACVPITAPVSGQVLQIFDPSERVVAAGEPVLQIGDPRQLEVVVDLLSTDAVKVEAGQRVLLERWGGSETIEGRVERIEPFGFTKVSALGIEEQRVNVVIQLTSPYETWRRLGHGYQVEARIVLWQSEDVLSIPLTALFRDGEGWAVFVKEGGRAVQRQVEVGHRNRLVCEVVSGLSVGERLVLHPSDRVVPGRRISDRG
jgi:HlyD family secretion protein